MHRCGLGVELVACDALLELRRDRVSALPEGIQPNGSLFLVDFQCSHIFQMRLGAVQVQIGRHFAVVGDDEIQIVHAEALRERRRIKVKSGIGACIQVPIFHVDVQIVAAAGYGGGVDIRLVRDHQLAGEEVECILPKRRKSRAAVILIIGLNQTLIAGGHRHPHGIFSWLQTLQLFGHVLTLLIGHRIGDVRIAVHKVIALQAEAGDTVVNQVKTQVDRLARRGINVFYLYLEWRRPYSQDPCRNGTGIASVVNLHLQRVGICQIRAAGNFR